MSKEAVDLKNLREEVSQADRRAAVQLKDVTATTPIDKLPLAPRYRSSLAPRPATRPKKLQDAAKDSGVKDALAKAKADPEAVSRLQRTPPRPPRRCAGLRRVEQVQAFRRQPGQDKALHDLKQAEKKLSEAIEKIAGLQAVSCAGKGAAGTEGTHRQALPKDMQEAAEKGRRKGRTRKISTKAGQEMSKAAEKARQARAARRGAAPEGGHQATGKQQAKLAELERKAKEKAASLRRTRPASRRSLQRKPKAWARKMEKTGKESRSHARAGRRQGRQQVPGRRSRTIVPGPGRPGQLHQKDAAKKMQEAQKKLQEAIDKEKEKDQEEKLAKIDA